MTLADAGEVPFGLSHVEQISARPSEVRGLVGEQLLQSIKSLAAPFSLSHLEPQAGGAVLPEPYDLRWGTDGCSAK